MFTANKSVSGSSCAIVASSSKSSSVSSVCVGSSGSGTVVVFCGCDVELDDVDDDALFVRGCLCVCFKLLSLVPEFVGVRLSPLGDLSCLVVSVPSVAR